MLALLAVSVTTMLPPGEPRPPSPRFAETEKVTFFLPPFAGYVPFPCAALRLQALYSGFVNSTLTRPPWFQPEYQKQFSWSYRGSGRVKSVSLSAPSVEPVAVCGLRCARCRL